MYLVRDTGKRQRSMFFLLRTNISTNKKTKRKRRTVSKDIDHDFHDLTILNEPGTLEKCNLENTKIERKND